MEDRNNAPMTDTQAAVEQFEPTSEEIAETIRLGQYFGIEISYERAAEMTRERKRRNNSDQNGG